MAVNIPSSMLPSKGPAVAPAEGDARARLASNFETFLTLLTTQLKNQDPLSPMDGNQFTQQLVQMTGVEQQLQANDLLKKLVSQGEKPPLVLPGGIDLIGKTIVADGSKSLLTDEGASWTYELPADAKSGTLKVTNAASETVWTGDLTKLTKGRHPAKWDGKIDGKEAPRGVYTLQVSARNAEGQSLAVPVNIVGVAKASELIDGETWLSVDDLKIRLDKIVSVRATA